jgi:uncharacterized C2H2 Zn-finger protein
VIENKPIIHPTFIPPSELEACPILLFGSPVASCSRPSQLTIISTSSSMSNEMECPKCSRIFWSQRSFAGHAAKCRGSLHGRTSLHNRSSPTHHQVAAAVNNASSSSTVQKQASSREGNARPSAIFKSMFFGESDAIDEFRATMIPAALSSGHNESKK